MSFSVIIPVFERYKETISLLDSILAKTDLSEVDQIFLVNDGSSDKQIDHIQGLMARVLPIKMVKQSHLGPVAAINKVLPEIKSDYVAVISSDAELVSAKEAGVQGSAHPLNSLARVLDSVDDIGLVAPMVLVKGSLDKVLTLDYTFAKGTTEPRPMGLLLPTKQIASWMPFTLRSAMSVRGTCLMFRRSMIDGLYNQLHPWFRWQDDLCMRIRAEGKYCAFTNKVMVAHGIYGDSIPNSFSELTREEFLETNRKFRERWADRQDLFDPASLYRKRTERIKVNKENFLQLFA